MDGIDESAQEDHVLLNRGGYNKNLTSKSELIQGFRGIQMQKWNVVENQSYRFAVMEKALLLILFLLNVGVHGSFAQSRFFEANSMCYFYRFYPKVYFPLEGKENEGESSDFTYSKVWLGPDSVMNERPCVTIWEQDQDVEDAVFRGFIYESEDGMVYTMLRNMKRWHFRYYEDKWYLLYDFSNPDWKEGDRINWSESNSFGIEDHKIQKVSVLNLLTCLRASLYLLLTD